VAGEREPGGDLSSVETQTCVHRGLIDENDIRPRSVLATT